MKAFFSRLVLACCLAVLLPLGSRALDLRAIKQTEESFSMIIEKAKPAVVYIQVKKEKKDQAHPEPFTDGSANDPILKDFLGDKFFRQDGESLFSDNTGYGFGSGFIFNTDGYILTNSHVIRDGVEILVTLADRRKVPAKIIGEDRKTDIGLLKIDEKNLPTLPLGDSEELKSGHWVLAIGSPYEFIQTVTAGIVSATGRSSLGVSDYEDFIQTDAAINPGNSGGPLINIEGKAIGINTAFLSKTGGYMGIGFAIPINMARTISERLLKEGKVTRAWLGVGLKDPEAAHLTEQGLSPATRAARVVEVAENSPAGQAGLQAGDLILEINQTPVSGSADLRNRIALSTPKSEITLRYYRTGRENTCRVILGTL